MDTFFIGQLIRKIITLSCLLLKSWEEVGWKCLEGKVGRIGKLLCKMQVGDNGVVDFYQLIIQ